MPIGYLDFMRALAPYDLNEDGRATPEDGVPAERLARDLGLMADDRLLSTDPGQLSDAMRARRGYPLTPREASWTAHALEEAGATQVAGAFRNFTNESNVQLAIDVLEGFLETHSREPIIANGLRFERQALEELLRRSKRGDRRPGLIQTLSGTAFTLGGSELSPAARDRLGALAYASSPTVRLTQDERLRLRDAITAETDLVAMGEYHLHAGSARAIRDLIFDLEGGPAAVGALVLESDHSLQGSFDEVVALHRALADFRPEERRLQVYTAMRQFIDTADESVSNILGSFSPDLPSRRHTESLEMLWAALERGIPIRFVDQLDHDDARSRDAIMSDRIVGIRQRVAGPIVGLFGALHVTRGPLPEGPLFDAILDATDIDRRSLVIRAREQGLDALGILLGPAPLVSPELFDLSMGQFDDPA